MVMIFEAEFSADPEERIARAEKRLCSLQRSASVADIFIRIAERKALALETGEETEGGQEALDAFVKASRILHVSVALQPRVEKELAALRAGDPLVETTPRRSHTADPPEPERDRMLLRRQIRGFVLELTDPDSLDDEECERVYTQINERLYKSDRYDALLDLPLKDAVEAICEDLGVRPQYEQWEGLDWPPWRVGKPAPAPPEAGAWRLEAREPSDEIPPRPPP